MPRFNLDEIVALLSNNHRRATYGSVAAYLGVNHREVMSKRPRDFDYSWVVLENSGRPSEYQDTEIDPVCLSQSQFGLGNRLSTRLQLSRWLDEVSPPQTVPSSPPAPR
jgi:hypothetical protein